MTGGDFFDGSDRRNDAAYGCEVSDYALDQVDYPRDSFASIAIRVMVLMLSFFFYFFFQIAFFLPGFNYLNAGIFVLATILFLLAFTSDGNTAAIKNFKGKKMPYGSPNIYKACSGSRPEDARGIGSTWISMKGNYYAISFFENKYRDSNIKQVYDTVQRSPSIIWMSSKVWVLTAFASLLASPFFYRLANPVFGQAAETDIAALVMDRLVFYFPSVLALLCAVACLVFRKTRHKLLYACAKRIVENNYAADMRVKTYGMIENAMSRKWFYNECPNCGNTASKNVTACEFCGSPLEIVSYNEIDHDRMHRLEMKEGEHV